MRKKRTNYQSGLNKKKFYRERTVLLPLFYGRVQTTDNQNKIAYFTLLTQSQPYFAHSQTKPSTKFNLPSVDAHISVYLPDFQRF